MSGALPLLLNAGFGLPLGRFELNWIRALGFTGVRQSQEIPKAPEADVDALVAEFAGRNLELLFNINTTSGSVTEVVARAVAVADACEKYRIPCNVEPINEPDAHAIYWDRPTFFADTIHAVYEAIASRGARVVSGGITSTSKQGLAYLRAAMPELPLDCTVGVHTYRSTAPDKPLPGFSSRQEEFDELRALVGPRSIWGTEVGWTDGPRSRWPCVKPLSESEVARRLRTEFKLYVENGFERCLLFQLNDGRGREEHFGIKTINGRVKESAHVAGEA